MEQPEASQATATVTAADSETAVEPADGGATATATATDQSSIDAPAVASETSAAITASEIDDKAGPDDSTPPADKPVLGDVVGTAADVLGFGAWVRSISHTCRVVLADHNFAHVLGHSAPFQSTCIPLVLRTRTLVGGASRFFASRRPS